MTKVRVLSKKLDIPEIDGYKLQYLSMKLKKDPVTTCIVPDYDSDSSSDTSNGSSGDYSDFAEEDSNTPSSSSDLSRTIGYTPP